MLKKITIKILIAVLVLSSFYMIPQGSFGTGGIDTVSAATAPAPTPKPTPAPIPTPAPTPVPKPVIVPVVKPVVVPPVILPPTPTWLSSPSSWAIPEIAAAQQKGLMLNDLMNQYNKPITRLEFTRLILRLHESLNGVVAVEKTDAPFSDTASLEVQKAYVLGLVKGIQNGAFNPNGILTRQEAAVIFHREWLLSNNDDLNTPMNQNFKDIGFIAPWAKNDMSFMVALGLMKGNDKNMIDPKGPTTREQTMALLVRYFQKSADLAMLDVLTPPDTISSATGQGTSSSSYDDDEYDD